MPGAYGPYRELGAPGTPGGDPGDASGRPGISDWVVARRVSIMNHQGIAFEYFVPPLVIALPRCC